MTDDVSSRASSPRSEDVTTTFKAGHENAAGPFSHRILDIGFITALLLAGLCLVLSATYLYSCGGTGIVRVR